MLSELRLSIAAQPAHPADAASGEQDRAILSVRICYNAFATYQGGAADGQSVRRLWQKTPTRRDSRYRSACTKERAVLQRLVSMRRALSLGA